MSTQLENDKSLGRDVPSGRMPQGQGKGGLKPLIRRLHFYAGLFIGPFILIAALSGAAYAITPTVENIVYGDLIKVEPVEHSVALQEQIEKARAAYPEMEVAQVWPANEVEDSTRVLLVDESLGEERLRSVFINPADGSVLGSEPSYSGLGEMPLRRFVSSMHESFFMGKVGEMYSELAASWMWFVALGGLVLWISRVGGKKIFGGLRSQSGRNKLVNLHGVAGAWLLIVMLGLSVTGITWSAFAGENVGSLISAIQGEPKTIETSLNGTSGASGGAGDHSEHSAGMNHGDTEAAPLTKDELSGQAQTVLDAARGQGLTGPVRLYPPEDNQHAWQASERWVPWRTTSDEVSVDGNTGKVVDSLPFAELPLFSKLTSWGIYLHMGIMFGLPLQLLLLVSALGIAAMVVLGYVMWWKRRPTRYGVAGTPGPNQPLRIWEWVVVLAFLGTVGVFLPLFGLTLGAMLLADRVLARRAAKYRDFAAEPERTGSVKVDQ